MVESEPVASGVRWPKSNWEILDYASNEYFLPVRGPVRVLSLIPI